MDDISIPEMCRLAEKFPRLLELEGKLLQIENIKERCEGNKQCEWRYNSLLHRLNKEASKYKDKTARLNFIIARLFKFIEENY